MKTKTRRRKKPDPIGWFWHVHHANFVPIEWCWSYRARRHTILFEKDPTERPVRMALLRPVDLSRFPKTFQRRAALATRMQRANNKYQALQLKKHQWHEGGGKLYRLKLQMSGWIRMHPAFVIQEHERQCVDRKPKTAYRCCCWSEENRCIFPGMPS